MRLIRRSTAMLAAAAVLAVPARGAAQRIEVPAAPWGSARAEVIQGIQGLGYEAVADTSGAAGLVSVTFTAGGTQLVAVFGPNGLAMLNQIQQLPPPEARRRLAELRDSVTRVLGPPDTAGVHPIWVRPDGRLQLHVRPDSGGLTSAAIVGRARPNYIAELAAVYRQVMRAVQDERAGWLDARLDSSRWVRLFAKDSAAISIDRSSVERLEGGAWRVTVRWDWLVPQRDGRLRYDAMVHGTEVRCDEGTYRMGRTQWYLGETPGQSTGARWGRWNTPVPTSGGAVIVTRFCEYARGLPAPPPAG